MRATGFTHIVFPNYALTQVKVSCSADRRRARGVLRAGRIGQNEYHHNRDQHGNPEH